MACNWRTVRALLPVVRERQQLADALARYMTTLGLERRAKPVPSIREILAEYEGRRDGRGDARPRAAAP
jgi:hypothetical protein